MDFLEGLDELARRAREESTPVFGVSDAVRLRILSERPQTVTLIPLGLFGGLSALAASITLALAVQFWSYVTSPVMELVVPLPEIRLW
ncbi:MAG: hypothetical protein MUC88_09260 [Planctomycetes bacterium]|jgi:hypothetical protein|nr:hypothetical protein [Planctomycetota bacterium]